MTRNIIMARHGESEASAVGLVNGDPSRSIGLSERGRQEARSLGVALAGQALDLCIVTEFPRTRETADIALEGRPVPRFEVAELNDPRVGDLEGRPIHELREWFRRNGAAADVPGGGENRVEAVRRFCRGLGVILQRPEEIILVIAHGLPVTYTVVAARGEDLPLTLERVQVDHAVPHRMSSSEVERAISVMGRWAREQEAAA
jgi:2,3-bisphosphoglycerate-dependent phosphoglycerate mutase